MGSVSSNVSCVLELQELELVGLRLLAVSVVSGLLDILSYFTHRLPVLLDFGLEVHVGVCEVLLSERELAVLVLFSRRCQWSGLLLPSLLLGLRLVRRSARVQVLNFVSLELMASVGI